MKRKRIRSPVKTLVAYAAYTDHATKDDDWVASQRPVEGGKKSSGGPKVPFPSTLHRLLDEVEAAGHASIVGWLPHGRAFKVQNQELFVSAVLPIYFKLQSSYNSFLRQLNVYGFRRLVGPHQDQNAYYHEYFLRGRIHLCTLMTRYSTSTTGAVRCTFDPETEPNFYVMPPLPSCQASTSVVPAVSDPNEISHDLSCGPVSLTDCLRMNTFNSLHEIETAGSDGRTCQEDSLNMSQANLSSYQQWQAGQVAYPSMPSPRDGLSLSSNEIPQGVKAVTTYHEHELVPLPASARIVPLSYMTPARTRDVPVRPRQRPQHAPNIAGDLKLQDSRTTAYSRRIPNEHHAAFAHSLRSVHPPIAAFARHDETARKTWQQHESPASPTRNQSIKPVVPDHDDASLLALFDTLMAAIPDSYPYAGSLGTLQNNNDVDALNLLPAAAVEAASELPTAPLHETMPRIAATHSGQQMLHSISAQPTSRALLQPPFGSSSSPSFLAPSSNPRRASQQTGTLEYHNVERSKWQNDRHGGIMQSRHAGQLLHRPTLPIWDAPCKQGPTGANPGSTTLAAHARVTNTASTAIPNLQQTPQALASCQVAAEPGMDVSFMPRRSAQAAPALSRLQSRTKSEKVAYDAALRVVPATTNNGRVEATTPSFISPSVNTARHPPLPHQSHNYLDSDSYRLCSRHNETLVASLSQHPAGQSSVTSIPSTDAGVGTRSLHLPCSIKNTTSEDHDAASESPPLNDDDDWLNDQSMLSSDDSLSQSCGSIDS